jgi:hypothetical protein
MNTGHKPTLVQTGRHCDHVHLKVGDTIIRLTQDRSPNINPETGYFYEGPCPVPRCEETR